MNTGSIIAGRPSMGSWIVYGLGAETQDLPGFVVLVSSGKGGQMQPIAARQWSAGFLPSRFQGVKLNSHRRPGALHPQPAGHRRRDAEGLDRRHQPAQQDRAHRRRRIPEILTRIAQYEMAFQMQTSVPDLVDMSKEPAAGARGVRREAGRRLVRVELPAGAAAGGARRALHPALPPRLGPPLAASRPNMRDEGGTRWTGRPRR